MGEDRKVRRWKSSSQSAVSEFPLGNRMQPLVAISPNGELVAAADEQLYVWKADGGKPVTTVKLSDDPLAAMLFSPDGKTLAIGTRQGRVQLIDAGSGNVLRERSSQRTPVTALAFSVDGKSLFAAHREGLFVSDTADGFPTPETFDGQFTSGVYLLPLTGGRRLAGLNEKGEIVAWACDLKKRIAETQESVVLDVLMSYGTDKSVANADRQDGSARST